MNLQNLLARPCMARASLLHTNVNLETEITGVNVLEAPDIQYWGREGVLILSSFFALQDMSPPELKHFVHEMQRLKISGLVVKTGRLVETIPPDFSTMMAAAGVPFISIDTRVKYEDIIVEVLGDILAHRERQLSHFYQVSAIAAEMALSVDDTHVILERFHELLGYHLSLGDSSRAETVTTDVRYVPCTVGKPIAPAHSDALSLTFNRFECRYTRNTGQTHGTVLLIDLTCVDEGEHWLYVHVPAEAEVTDEQIIVVENLIRTLQTAILRAWSGRQQQAMRRNSAVAELLRSNVTNPVEFATLLEILEFEPDQACLVLTVELPDSADISSIASNAIRNRLTRLLRGRFPTMAFYTAPKYIQCVIPDPHPANLVTPESLTRLIQLAVAPERADIAWYAGLSDQISIREASRAAIQSRTTATFMRRNDKAGMVEQYGNLGVLKLFVRAEEHQLRSFIPPALADLREHEHDLYDTLRTFLVKNQNLKQTAEALGIHPKTAKYRIDKLRQRGEFALTDIHQTTILLTAMEIFDFLETRQPR